MSFIRYFWLMLGLAAASAVIAMAIAKAHEEKAALEAPVDDASVPETPVARKPDLWGPDPRLDPFAT